MKQSKYNALLRMVSASVAFTFVILIIRIIFTGNLHYANYFWNIFLAAIPVVFASLLLKRKWNLLITSFFFLAWLLFLPNAPYLITDLIHYEPRTEFPGWADILLVTSASWNGLLLGFISIMIIEDWLSFYFKNLMRNFIVIICLGLTGYGIYLGRYLRYNTWDIVTNPVPLFYDTLSTVISPVHHPRAWGFTFLFGLMYAIFYYTLRQLQVMRHPLDAPN